MTGTALHLTHTLRVGVTGLRKVCETDPKLIGRVDTVLRQIVASIPKAEAPPVLRILSPLAKGADRIVARCAINHGFELTCPMPFPREMYAADFSDDSLTDFNDLLDRYAGDRILCLDGDRSTRFTHPDGSPLLKVEQERENRRAKGEETRAYEAVGRLIVRNTDLIIAIWDGLPGKGAGGTADTIRYAASFGPPVLWINAIDPDAPVRWIEEAHDLRPGIVPRMVELTLSQTDIEYRPHDEVPLFTYLHRLLKQPEPSHHDDDGGFLRMVARGIRWGDRKLTGWSKQPVEPKRPGKRGRRERFPPLHALPDGRPLPKCWLWKMHSGFIRLMAGSWREPAKTTAPAIPMEAKVWRCLRRIPGERASECSFRYRSSYVLIFLLATLAVIVSAAGEADIGGAGHWPQIREFLATLIEFSLLAGVGWLVVANVLYGWQDHSIEWRLLGELCRKQQALAPLAWVTPRAHAWVTATRELPSLPDVPHVGGASLPAWQFSAWVRACPLPTGTFDSGRVARARDSAIHELLDEQVNYHAKRAWQMNRAARRLIQIGQWVFLFVLIAVFGRLILIASGSDGCGWMTILHLAGTILPAISAAVVGIRAYAEMEMLAEQSAVMRKALWHAREQIAQIDPAAPLASQTLGSALASVATLMLEDLEGWARLFRAKVVEA